MIFVPPLCLGHCSGDCSLRRSNASGKDDLSVLSTAVQIQPAKAAAMVYPVELQKYPLLLVGTRQRKDGVIVCENDSRSSRSGSSGEARYKYKQRGNQESWASVKCSDATSNQGQYLPSYST